MADLIGQRIGDFVIEERIGQGGMATVYRATQQAMGRDVALKVLRRDDENLPSNDDFQQRFAQEARVIAALEHIHVLPVFDYGIDGDVAYLAMRLLRGGSLADLLKATGGPLPLPRIIEIFTQMARGLAYAHAHDVLHRDLKPGNILFDSEHNVFLADFGLAKMLNQGSASLTQTENIVGTPYYMSPEQLRGETLDRRSDIYSMGVVLYEMLTGTRPFDAPGADYIPVIYQHLEARPEPPARRNPGVPPAVSDVVLKALAKRPDARYSDVMQMANALREAIGLPPATTSEIAAISSGWRMPRQHGPLRQIAPAVVIVAAVVLVLGLLAAQPTARQHGDRGGPTAAATATITAGAGLVPQQVGRPADVLPTPDEIAAARARLGEDGFIAIITCNLNSEYHATINRELTGFARAYDLPVEIYDSNDDEFSQAPLIERARAEGAAGLIVCPLDLRLVDESLSAVERDGLPLVMTSAGNERYGGVSLIGDNYSLGQTPGRYGGAVVNEEFGGSARVIILDYPTIDSLVLRADGLQDGLLEVAPDAEVIGRYPGATRENGYESVRGLLEAGVAFDVILSINDAGARGAIDALEEAAVPPDEVAIVSVDAEAWARQLIREGRYLRGSVTVARTLAAQVMIDSVKDPRLKPGACKSAC